MRIGGTRISVMAGEVEIEIEKTRSSEQKIGFILFLLTLEATSSTPRKMTGRHGDLDEGCNSMA